MEPDRIWKQIKEDIRKGQEENIEQTVDEQKLQSMKF